MGKRIYLVRDKHDAAEYLVNASSQAAAIKHVTDGQFEASAAKAARVAALMGAGHKVEEAGEENADG